MNLEASFVVRDDHPSLSGHFPDNPVVPGAVILDEALAALSQGGETRVSRINRAKFAAPLPLNVSCQMRATPRKDGIVAIECIAEDVLILFALVECATQTQTT